jgi:hypothetical protein
MIECFLPVDFIPALLLRESARGAQLAGVSESVIIARKSPPPLTELKILLIDNMLTTVLCLDSTNTARTARHYVHV